MKTPAFFNEIKPYLKTSQGSLFAQEENLVIGRLKELPSDLQTTLFYYLLSEDDKIHETLTLLLETWEKDESINFYANPLLFRILTTSQKVRREIHRMKGFLRFQEVEGGYLYASFRPKYNIIFPLSKYFANRLRNEKILLHDLMRNILIFCHQEKIYPARLVEPIPPKTLNEKLISHLWVHYFEQMGIKERSNSKLQKQKVPLKYRNFMIEFYDLSLLRDQIA